MKKLKEISTVGMSREEWLELRRGTIGGSDAAAIVGLSSWESPLSVYMNKKGLTPDKEDTLAMWLGRELEETVAKLFCIEMEKRGTPKKVRRRNSMIYNMDYPFAHANVDRWIVGENAGLECKTTSELNLKRIKNGEYPPYYYCQCVHYMAVTGAKKWYLAVLVGNKEFHVFTIERDEEEIKALMDAERAFSENHLVPSIMPEAIGTDADDAALKAAYPECEDNNVVNMNDMKEVFDAYATAKATLNLAERAVKQAEQDIKARLQTASEGFCGAYKVTWKAQTRNDIDKDKLKAMGIDIPYTQKTVRTFRFTAVK